MRSKGIVYLRLCFVIFFPLALAVYYKKRTFGGFDGTSRLKEVITMPSGIRYLFTALLAGVAPWLDFSAAQKDLVVDLGYARYRGVALENGITQWLGMRFAAPPLGDLRFRAPADPLTEEGITDAFTVSTSTPS